MAIVEERTDDILIEIIELDRATSGDAEQLRMLLNKGIDNGYLKIIVDLSVCNFIDSTFLGVLISTLKKVTPLKGDLKLVGFKPQIHSMFELTRLFRVFESFSDKQKAILSFGN